jgi:DnaJ-class molecular chaperone
MKDYYAQLGVAPDATPETIKSVYRKQASQYHPDRNSDPDAAQRFREAQEAYEVLSDDSRRKAYNETRHRSLIEEPVVVAKQIWKNIVDKASRL